MIVYSQKMMLGMMLLLIFPIMKLVIIGIFKPRAVNSVLVTNKIELNSDELHAFSMETNQQILDPLLYRNNFLEVPTETIKFTFEETTQFARSG